MIILIGSIVVVFSLVFSISIFSCKGKHKHTLISHSEIAPTCEQHGVQAHFECSDCKKLFLYSDASKEVTKNNLIIYLEHDIISHEGKTPTCTESGYEAYDTCSRCDYTTYKELAPLEHHIISHEAKAPTCTESGYEAYDTCSRCDYTTYKELSSLNHDIISHEAKAPTCTEVGYEAYDTCSRCDYTTYKELSTIAHNYLYGACTKCGADDSEYVLTESDWQALWAFDEFKVNAHDETNSITIFYKNQSYASETSDNSVVYYTKEDDNYYRLDLTYGIWKKTSISQSEYNLSAVIQNLFTPFSELSHNQEKDVYYASKSGGTIEYKLDMGMIKQIVLSISGNNFVYDFYKLTADDELIVPTGHTFKNIENISTSCMYEIISNDPNYPFNIDNGIFTSTNKDDNSTSSLKILILGNGELNITYHISSEEDYDGLKIIHNGNVVLDATGIYSNQSKVLNVNKNDTIEFVYYKDDFTTEGDDKVTIDLTNATTLFLLLMIIV